MEFASLEDAFPNTEDFNKKKMQKKSKSEGFQSGDLPPTDADRPAVKRMDEVGTMSRSPREAVDELMDESTKFLRKPTVNNSLPKVKSVNSFEKADLPSYFGAEPFTNPSEDSHAPFINSSINPNAFMLEADFAKSFDVMGLGKASGVDLPVPELRHRWKRMSADKVESSEVAPKPRSSQLSGMDTSDFHAMKSKIDELMSRLDDLEHRAAGANPQLEVMTFIMTGLFLMFVVDLAVRKSSSMRMVNVR
jgi:hypothetical protein